jgi:hypothetical protein
MNIGQITRRDNGRNGSVLVGRIDTLAISMTIGLREVNNPKETAPKYEIMAKTKAGAWVRVGALFEQTSRASGDVLSGADRRSLHGSALSIALFRNDGDDGIEAYNVAWSRRRPRQELATRRVMRATLATAPQDGARVMKAWAEKAVSLGEPRARRRSRGQGERAGRLPTLNSDEWAGREGSHNPGLPLSNIGQCPRQGLGNSGGGSRG